MKIQFADRTKIAFSSTRKIFDQVSTINKEREKLKLSPLIDLSIGQPHIPANPIAFDAIQQHLNDKENTFGYSPITGRLETLQAIIDLYRLYYPNINYTTQEVMFTHGANQAIWNALSIFIQERNHQPDIVIAFEPYFGQYKSQVNALGGKLVGVTTDFVNFDDTLNNLENTLTDYPSSKMLILNYPNNPSGKVLEISELHKLITILNKYPDLILILDDVYREIHFKSIISLLDIDPSLKNRSIVINSGSKGLIGAPDLRVGTVAAPSTWIKLMAQQQMLTTAGVSQLSQIAFTSTVNAKTNPTQLAWEKRAITEYQSCIAYVSDNIDKTGLKVVEKPGGSFYLLLDGSHLLGYEIPTSINLDNSKHELVTITQLPDKIGNHQLATDEDIASYFLHTAGVALIPGSSFGLPASKGWLRISCAAQKNQLSMALDRMTEAYNMLIKSCNKTQLATVKKHQSDTMGQKNIAIIGVGNVGEWLANMMLQEMLTGQLTQINKIYYLGRHFDKLSAKLTDQLHAVIIQHSYLNHLSLNIDHIINKIVPSDDYAVLKDIDIILLAFGAPMNSEICERSDLLLANNRIATHISENIRQYASPKTLVINIANPLDVITWQIQRKSQLPASQVIGVSGVIDISRLAQAIHEVAHIDYRHIDLNSLIVCGEHGPAMVPLLSRVTIAGKPLLQQISPLQAEKIIHRTKTIGTQIMESLGKTPPHIGPARAALIMLQAILTGAPKALPCSIWNEKFKAYIGSVVSYTHNSFEIHNTPISSEEEMALTIAAKNIQRDMNTLNADDLHLNKNPMDSATTLQTLSLPFSLPIATNKELQNFASESKQKLLKSHQ